MATQPRVAPLYVPHMTHHTLTSCAKGTDHAGPCERALESSKGMVIPREIAEALGPGVAAAPDTKVYATGSMRSNDADGTRYDLVSPVGLRRLAETYATGAVKYGAHNWRKGQPFSDLLNHAIKHLYQWQQGDQTEDHLAHAAWGLFALMEFEETRPELDDRFVFPKA